MLLQRCTSLFTQALSSRPVLQSLSRTTPLPFAAVSARFVNTDNIQALIQRTVDRNAPGDTPDDRWRKMSGEALARVKQNPPAGPYSGNVQVAKNKLGDAIQKLDSILSKNKVRQRLRLAERHEKRGEKLRRLRSERWRKQFANEVRKKVQLVTKIRNRGA